MSITIKIPAMPDAVAISDGSFNCNAPLGMELYSADQLAARDAQWQEMYGPVVEALKEIMSDMDSDFGTGYDYDKARAALSAITEE